MSLQPYVIDAVPPGARRLHLNEGREPHPPAVLAALGAAAAALAAEGGAPLACYSAGAGALAAAAAAYLGTTPAHVLVTAGSDEALRAAVDAAAARGCRLAVAGQPGYTHFEHFVRLRGLALRPFQLGLAPAPADCLAALRYHAPAMAEGCLVYLGSPGNPGGEAWAPAAVAALAAEFPRSFFVVDEAYIEFAAAAAAPPGGDPRAALEALSAGAAARAAPGANLVVVRTLSKAFGLAALRVGYATGAPAALAALAAGVSPKALGPLAEAVGAAALRAAPAYLAAAGATAARAEATAAALRAAGWWAGAPRGNFFLLYAGPAPGAAPALVAALAARGLAVRDRGGLPGLAGFVRVTGGSAADAAALLAALCAPGAFPGARGGALPPQAACYTPKAAVAGVKGLVRAVAALLAGAGVPFWAHSGTLLGALRHGGVVPWDDDADLAYARGAGGADPVAPLAPAFAAAGLALLRNRTDAYWQVGAQPPGAPPLDGAALRAAPHLDLFSFSLEAAGDGGGAGAPPRYLLDDPRYREEAPENPHAHCNTSYAPEELFPLAAAPFYELALPVPRAAAAALRRALGDDWAATARARAPGSSEGAPRLLAFPIADFTPG